MLTSCGLDGSIIEALRAGASGFFVRDAPVEELILAVRVVVVGDAQLSPGRHQALARSTWAPPRPGRATRPRCTRPADGGANERLRLLASERQMPKRQGAERVRVRRQNARLRRTPEAQPTPRVPAVIYAYANGLARHPGPVLTPCTTVWKNGAAARERHGCPLRRDPAGALETSASGCWCRSRPAVSATAVGGPETGADDPMRKRHGRAEARYCAYDVDGSEAMSWRIRGTYFESCNCEAICPCRRIDGVPGGRSTHGVCMGVLSWLVKEGVADGIDLSGLPVALACRYSDDEPGSPWTWVLYLDAGASDEQRGALEGIFTGRLGGDAERHFPWAWKASEFVAVRPVEITVDHTRRRQRLRIRDHVHIRIRGRYEGDETVTCVIPGHERAGEELVTDELVVQDGKLSFDYHGVCGYGSTFDYAG
jgi:hypothetical protein